MISWKYVAWGSKKWRFFREQEGVGIIGSLAKFLSDIPLVGPVFFRGINTLVKGRKWME